MALIVEPEIFSRTLRQKIQEREKSRAKAEFLRAVFSLPCADQIILRGGSALHGVYLHKRWSEDTDFFAPLALVDGFASIAREHGLVLEEREMGITPVYVTRGIVHERVQVAYDMIFMHYPEESFLTPHWQTYHAMTGETVQVRTYSLAALLARKLRYVMRRRFAVDFYDLWTGLIDYPECTEEIRAIVAQREAPREGISPSEIYNAAVALERLSMLEPTWAEELTPLMRSVPSFSKIQIDLQARLPTLEA